MEYLLRSNCGKLLDLGIDYYPQLVHMLYANLRIVKTGPVISLECQVKHTKFTLTKYELNIILHLPTVTPPPLSQTEARNHETGAWLNLLTRTAKLTLSISPISSSNKSLA